MKRMTKKVLVSLLVASIGLVQIDSALARLGDTGGAKKTPQPARALVVNRPAPLPAQSTQRYDTEKAAQPSRVGGGQSLGMQRRDVVERAKQRDQSYGQTSAQGQTNYAGVSEAVRSGQDLPASRHQDSGGYKPGWGTVAGAAAVGGVAGYMLGKEPDRPQVVQAQSPAPVSAVTYPDQDGAQTVGAAPGYGSYKSSGNDTSWIGLILGTLVLLVAGVFFVRKVMGVGAFAGSPGPAKSSHFSMKQAQNAPVFTDVRPQWAQDLYDRALMHFEQIQQANNRGDVGWLNEHLGKDLYPRIKELIDARGGPDDSIFRDIGVDLEDATEEADGVRIVSLRYRGTVVSSGVTEKLDEMWHFVQHPDESVWRLNGIEQVA